MIRPENRTELHVHTYYSLLDGLPSPTEIINNAVSKGMKSIALTDHGFLGGMAEFFLQAKRKNIKPIYGIEMYETSNTLSKDKDNRYYHLLVLCKNNNGMREINKIVKRSTQEENFYYKPRIEIGWLKPFADDLIVSTACLNGRINKISKDEKIEFVKQMKSIFKNFYIELQSHNTEDQITANKELLEVAQLTNTPIVITCDAHMLNEEDLELHGRFKSIVTNSKKTPDEIGEIYKDCYIQTVDDIYKKMSYLPEEIINEGINNSNIIADICNVEMDFYNMKFPAIDIPSKYKNIREFIESRIQEGWQEREYYLKSPERQKEAKERIKYELDVIENKGYLDYFAIVDDFLKYNKEQGYLPPKGRGCFTDKAIIVTNKELKTINKVNIGDKVISDDGNFHEVVNKYKYKIQEDMIEFGYQKQGSSNKKYKNICTQDHKILVNRNNKNIYIEAEKLKINDLLCSPKIKNIIKEDVIIDLNKYNNKNYKYDDNYIYEVVQGNIPYKYSPAWMEQNNIVNRTFAKKIINGYIPKNNKGIYLFNKLLFSTPFKNVENYINYCKNRGFVKRKIKRFIRLNSISNMFIGLMYGDGFTAGSYGLGLAMHKTNRFQINNYIFNKFAEYAGLNKEDLYTHSAKNKKLKQIYLSSKILNNWFKNEYFLSKKSKDKIFNENLFLQSNKNLKYLYYGLHFSDGSREKNKICFDNTSLSLINAYKIISNILEFEPLSLDVRESWIYKGKYNCKESYKLRKIINRQKSKILNDENYWYLPIKKIIKHKDMECEVYDLEVKDNHSFMINNIIVHNSCCGSSVAYFMMIHDVDPLDYDLLFERFLNPDPKDTHIPDIDADFCHTVRQDVVDYCTRKYGSSQVCNIGLYSYMKAKTAIKDVGKSLEIPFFATNEISKTLSDDTKLSEYIEEGKHQKWIDKYSKFQIKEMFEIGAKLQGIPKSFGSHPSGKIISNKILEEEMGMAVIDGENVCMYDMHYVEDLGFVKFDFLGLKTNTVIYDTLKMIGKDAKFIETARLNFKDDKVYEQFRLGNTSGIFQFSSYGMRDVLSKMQVDCIEDLIAANALFRPGAMDYIDTFCNNKQHPEDIKYINDSLKSILGVTYAQLVYQEQMMAIGKMANVPSVDDLRRACGKKKIDLMKQQEVYLKEGLIKNNWTQEQVDIIWEQMVKFGSYAFNKSHAAAYAVIAYITMYLKVYYPVEFMTALLNTYSNDNQLISKYIAEAQRMGIKVKVPHINKSDKNFKVDNGVILFGLKNLKDCGEVFVDKLLEERNKESFKNFRDFYARLKPDKPSVISLIKAGAFGIKNREQFLLKFIESLFEQKEYTPVTTSLPTIKVLKEQWGIEASNKEDRLKYYNAKRKILFDEEQIVKHDNHVKELREKYMSNPDMWEYDTMSMFITYNPLEKYTKYIRDFEKVGEGNEIVLIGVLASIQKKMDKNKKQFAFLDIYQNGDLVEVLCWHTQFKEYVNMLSRGKVVVILGKKSEGKVVLKELKSLEQWKQQKGIN